MSPQDVLALDVWLDHLTRSEWFDDQALAELCAQHPHLEGRLRDLRFHGGEPRDPLDSAAAALFSRQAERYRREELLGVGGMGIVHRAEDLQLHRKIALKAMRERPGYDTSASARFLEEAQIAAQLDHPGIVPVHEVGIDSDGRFFFAMKFVEGMTLESVFDLARGRKEGWTETRTVGVLLKVCEAMAYAHSKGVLHRDLKPRNIMVGRFGEVYVMDWGLAKAIDRADLHDLRPHYPLERPSGSADAILSESTLVTMDGTVLGTPAYMAPEQGRGETAALSARSDVYSVGAMLYHLLTGVAPYADATRRLSSSETLQLLVNNPPLPIREISASAPGELVAICHKAMEREPKNRYEGMLELAQDLRAYLEGRVVQAHRGGFLPHIRKWFRRNKALAAVATVAVLAIAIGVPFGTVHYWMTVRMSTEVSDLSAMQELERLKSEADDLWPATPTQTAALRAWLVRAEALSAAQGERVARLAEMGRSKEPHKHWWAAQLQELTSAVDALMHPSTGLAFGIAPQSGPGIASRLQFAMTVEERSLSGMIARYRWMEAIASIRDTQRCPHYRGLELAPQLGLLPIGQDPASGLWEFAHLESGSPAVRDAQGQLQLNVETGVVFVLIPSGVFLMGAQNVDIAKHNYVPDDVKTATPVHRVAVDACFISKYEMTQAQWTRLYGSNPSENTDSIVSGLMPVEQVTWFECETVMRRLDLCLPTEAQWEYAARAGTSSIWWCGDDPLVLSEVANLADRSWFAEYGGGSDPVPPSDDGVAWTARVGLYPPNPFGLLDVHGNVREWCRDRAIAYNAPHREGDGELIQDPFPNQAHMTRGGGWQNAPLDAAAAAREPARPETKSWDLGLRPARQIR